MFDINLFFVLVLVSIPGALFAARVGVGTIEGLIASGGIDQKLPPKNMLLVLAAVQSLVLAAIAAAIGAALAEQVGLAAPVFQAAATGDPIWPEMRAQLAPALGMGLVGALVFLVAYYAYFRSRLDIDTVQATEDLRGALGLWGRIFYGAIVEEILVRWGLMTLFLWMLSLIVESLTPLVYWAAILLAGLLFALGHIPGSLAAGAKKTPMFYAATLFLNGWAALIFGWLFWQHGLVAAMLAHALLHLLWYPLEKRTR
ncbi:MAG: CPBP family intramembrane metalloprotease [Chloroflexi bacterium]|nr:CPBP family intramembrane metalloprotease [Chloroflexota bacterium]